MKKMEISPSSSLATSPRTSWKQDNNPGSGFNTPHTPSRPLPQQMTMASSMAGPQPGTPQTPSRFITPTSPLPGTSLNLNLTPIPLNLGSSTGSQPLRMSQPAFGQNLPLFQSVQLEATPAAQLDPQYQLSSQSLPLTGNSAPLGSVPQPASQFTRRNSPIQTFGQPRYLSHPAQQSIHNTLNSFAVEAQQPKTGSVSHPGLQSPQSTQHFARQEPTASLEATPLVTQLLTHHHRQQSVQQQASNFPSSGGLLPTDYWRTLNTLPVTCPAQPASATTPVKKTRPNFHFGLSPLPVPPEALRQPQETTQSATVMQGTNPGFKNYREPAVDDETDEMDLT